MKYFFIGKSILVTGGSGTFGTAFVRYALDRGAKRVIVLSRGEHRQATLARTMNDRRLECWIGDVRDRDRLRWAFRAHPDIVVHAAALKRVEVCEQHPAEAIKTNVDGTRHVVEEAMWADIPRVLLISSDKATSPETTYGRSKGQAEDIAIGQNAYRGTGRTRISVVRYGNVLGSQGSFLEQLLAARRTGAPLPITDPEATRFWWSIDDAVAFVGMVLARMHGTEVWVPKLASAKVIDLAAAIAPASRLVITGTRGPEKVHEAMISATEARYTYELPDSFVLLPKRGAWWSPDPPKDAAPVGPEFRYSSDVNPLPVEFLEGVEPERGTRATSGAGTDDSQPTREDTCASR
jgi:UDP-N-acetylglucosamine 4,6-dehydratase